MVYHNAIYVHEYVTLIDDANFNFFNGKSSPFDIFSN